MDLHQFFLSLLFFDGGGVRACGGGALALTPGSLQSEGLLKPGPF